MQVLQAEIAATGTEGVPAVWLESPSLLADKEGEEKACSGQLLPLRGRVLAGSAARLRRIKGPELSALSQS